MIGKRPSNNPVVQQLDLLLSGYGYNFYGKKNQARADDLLVRQKAAASLGQAVQTVAALQAEYQRRCIPPATRANPYPSPEAMGDLRGIGLLRNRLSDLEAKIRGMPVPSQDKVWWRFRDELTLLNRLLTFDHALLHLTEQVCQQMHELTVDRWREGNVLDSADRLLEQLDSLIRDRQRFLLMPM